MKKTIAEKAMAYPDALKLIGTIGEQIEEISREKAEKTVRDMVTRARQELAGEPGKYTAWRFPQVVYKGIPYELTDLLNYNPRDANEYLTDTIDVLAEHLADESLHKLMKAAANSAEPEPAIEKEEQPLPAPPPVSHPTHANPTATPTTQFPVYGDTEKTSTKGMGNLFDELPAVEKIQQESESSNEQDEKKESSDGLPADKAKQQKNNKGASKK